MYYQDVSFKTYCSKCIWQQDKEHVQKVLGQLKVKAQLQIWPNKIQFTGTIFLHIFVMEANDSYDVSTLINDRLWQLILILISSSVKWYCMAVEIIHLRKTQIYIQYLVSVHFIVRSHGLELNLYRNKICIFVRLVLSRTINLLLFRSKNTSVQEYSKEQSLKLSGR